MKDRESKLPPSIPDTLNKTRADLETVELSQDELEYDYEVPTREDLEREQKAIEKVLDVIGRVETSADRYRSVVAEINKEEHIEINRQVQNLVQQRRFSLPRLFRGNKTATEYDSKVGNFSTQTRIVETSSGKKFFAVYNYPTSWVHRVMDNVMKRATGLPFHKAKSGEWKEQFESKSEIPTVPIHDERVVLMEYIPNMNMYDVIANRKKIKDFGPMPEVRNYRIEDAKKILQQAINTISEIHEKGKAWGELILPNMILGTDKAVHICDPEIVFDDSVDLPLAQAYDLHDFLQSAVSAMVNFNQTEIDEMVSFLLDEYQNPSVRKTLADLVAQKMTLKEKIFFSYTKVRLGLRDKYQYQAIRTAIARNLAK